MTSLFKAFSLMLVLVVLGLGSAWGAIKIGLSLPQQREERWVKDKERMMELAKKEHIELKFYSADFGAAKQVIQCEDLLTQNISVLILAPQDAVSAAVIVEKAHKAKVKVISYDRLVQNSDVDLYISFDNVKVGELQGEYIVKQAPTGNYVILSGAPTDSNSKLFKTGAMKIIKPFVDKNLIHIIMDQSVKDWQASEARIIIENVLAANNNKIDAILAPNDNTAKGAIQALAAQNMAGKVVVTGQDAELTAVQRIVEGTQSMTVFKDTRLLGEAAIQAAIDMTKKVPIDTKKRTVNNGKIDVPSLLLTPYLIHKGNIDTILIDSGYMKKENVYSNLQK